MLFLKCLRTGFFEWASTTPWMRVKHGTNGVSHLQTQSCSTSLSLPVQPHVLVRQSRISTASGYRPCQKSMWYNIKNIFREIRLFKDIWHQGSSAILQLRCWGRLDHPFLQQLALSTVGRPPESISKKAIPFRWFTDYIGLHGEEHWPPNQCLLCSFCMQRIELLRIRPQAGDHLGMALKDNALPSGPLPSSPLTQAGEGIKWASLHLIHCRFTPVSSNHFALVLFCIDLLS